MSNPWQPDPGATPAARSVPIGADSAWSGHVEPTEPGGPTYGGSAYYPNSTSYPGGDVGSGARHAASPDATLPGSSAWQSAHADEAVTGTHGPASTTDAPGQTGRRRMSFALVGAILAVAAAAVVGVIAGYRTAATEANANYGPRLSAAQSSASAADDRAGQLSADLAVARSSVASYQAAEAQASQEAADVPDLYALAGQYFSPTEFSGSASAVDITLNTYELALGMPELGEYLAALGFSDAVLDRMSHTRALDGTLTAEGRHCNVSWTYHPDNGLQMVFEATPGR